MLWLLLSVVAADPSEPVAFDADVLPLLARAGCNAAACHGGASGRGGFKLSLFGGDPEADYDAIVRQLEGRRVNFARPADSLLIDKPSGMIDHGGGVRFDFDGPEAELLAAWIAAGAPRSNGRQVERISVEPPSITLAAGDSKANARVFAHDRDGSRRDVTRLAIFSPGDESAVSAEADGSLAIARPGRHVIVVRYLTHVVAVPILAPLALPASDRIPEKMSDHWIDADIDATLAALRIAPGPASDDATFLRRLRLDLTGRLPTPAEVKTFAEDRSQDKREKLIDRLLASPDFVDYWTWQVSGWLRVRLAGDDRATTALHGWLRKQVAANAPYDRIARELLLSEGDSHDGPPAYHLLAGDARLEAEQVSETLLGIRVRCANCHNHPLDRWTQDDYHGLAAIFARLERGRYVRTIARGEVIHPRTGKAAIPRLPGERFLDANGDARGELADWMTNNDRPLLARATVNRLWKAMLGRGLVEPVDDLRATNPATHPPLLEALTADFVAHNYDLRHTLREIARSAAYARASRPTRERDLRDQFYAYAWSRPLAPELFVDALADVTGVPERYGSLQRGTRAIELPHPSIPNRALDALGRCGRGEGCETGEATGGGLAGRLHRLNGPLVNDKLADPAGRLARALADKRTNAEIVAEFYLLALGREPMAAERGLWEKRLATNDPAERRARLEDFVWSLLACEEFVTNH